MCHGARCINVVARFPEFLTPVEWEAEHGEKLESGAYIWRRWEGGYGWDIRQLWQVYGDTCEVLVVNGPYPPPNDWRKEE
jgi:hypothetical protein